MVNAYAQKAKLIRKWILLSTTEANSGHATSSLSATDFLTVFFDKYYTYDTKNPNNLANDRFVLSKGHAAPVFYALYAAAGAFPFDELLTLRKFGSRLEGHPTSRFPYTEAATGSLGQGLSIGCGIAMTLKKETRLKKKPFVYVVLGDGEMAEGQNWEAANFASYYGLDNVIAIVDANRLGQTQETMFGHRLKEYANRFKAFGWEVMVVDGHNYTQVEKAFEKATHNKTGKPFAIIAKTFKGAGISFIQNKDNWHGKPLPREEMEKALKELGPVEDKVVFKLRVPKTTVSIEKSTVFPTVSTSFVLGTEMATREVYGTSLAQVGEKNKNIVALDAEMKNSTYSQDFMKAFPDRFTECFIAEQNMVSVAVGFQRLGKIPFVSTFGTFLARAYDQIRMARLSDANIKFLGSHAGVSLGEDGSSQMGVEDMAMFGSIRDSVVISPADVVSCAKLVGEMAKHVGISYLRVVRFKTPVLYTDKDTFPLGGSKVLKQSKDDVLTIAATGICVAEALKAYEELKKDGILVRVIDCYCVKPVDGVTLNKAASETKKPIIMTIEDHGTTGGLGDNVLDAVAKDKVLVEKMGVTKIPHSGKPAELFKDMGIDAESLVARVKTLI